MYEHNYIPKLDSYDLSDIHSIRRFPYGALVALTTNGSLDDDTERHLIGFAIGDKAYIYVPNAIVTRQTSIGNYRGSVTDNGRTFNGSTNISNTREGFADMLISQDSVEIFKTPPTATLPTSTTIIINSITTSAAFFSVQHSTIEITTRILSITSSETFQVFDSPTIPFDLSLA